MPQIITFQEFRGIIIATQLGQLNKLEILTNEIGSEYNKKEERKKNYLFK